jgi:hypothetical protein
MVNSSAGAAASLTASMTQGRHGNLARARHQEGRGHLARARLLEFDNDATTSSAIFLVEVT